jgi:hypothetical protein
MSASLFNHEQFLGRLLELKAYRERSHWLRLWDMPCHGLTHYHRSPMERGCISRNSQITDMDSFVVAYSHYGLWSQYVTRQRRKAKPL